MTDEKAVVEQHDVRYDYAGFFGNHPRLTCRQSGCNEATLTAQPYMTTQIWAAKVQEFIAAHPPKQGQLTDDDRRRPPIRVEELVR